MDLVLDATELLPALVSRGRRRALLTLCRYGRASLVQLTYGGAGFESLAEHGEPAGPLAETLRGAENEIAFFEERLPASAPNDTHLVLSEPLLDEVQRKLIERFNLDAREALIQKHRLATLAVRFASLPQELPRLASDPGDDHIAATAIYGRAEAIVTSERQLLEDRSYVLEARKTLSAGLGRSERPVPHWSNSITVNCSAIASLTRPKLSWAKNMPGI